MYNEYNFPEEVVNEAAKAMHRWFRDEELEMCRVFKFSGAKNENSDDIEPVLWYRHKNAGGGSAEEYSSLVEVIDWVKACASNVG